MKDNCDLCFRNDNFHIFYLECLGCQSKICTLCASNISDDKNLPCLKCGKELISFKSSSKIKEMTCEFCLNVSNTYIFCDYCKINICKVCEEIILIKIFLRVSSKKIKTQNEKIMIEVIFRKNFKFLYINKKKIEELFSKSMIHDSSKFKFNIEGYLLQTFDVSCLSFNFNWIFFIIYRFS